jgi:beta-phosphoglucomutase-like phosphatase (HAD superfamily)
MELLGVGPDEAVVYEDSEIGMASARAAGIRTVIDIRHP